MAKISISQAMLLLNEGKEIPVLKRALPVFEGILAKANLHSIALSVVDPVAAQSHLQDKSVADDDASPRSQASAPFSQLEQHDNTPLFDGDFLGFEFLDEWQVGQLDFTNRY